MITKEELLEKLLETRIGDKHRDILKLALKGLESEDIMCEHRITVNNLRHEVDGLTRSRNFWRKKYDELADEFDDKIIALEEKLKNTISLKYHVQLLALANQKIDPLRQERDALKEELKAKDADLAVTSKTINDALTMQILQAQLTESMASHHASVDDANRQIISLRNERNAFQRLVGELEIEKSCIRADLENVCKERDAFKRLVGEMRTEERRLRANLENVCKELNARKDEIEKWKEAHYAKNADIDKLLTENGELKIRIEKFEAFFD